MKNLYSFILLMGLFAQQSFSQATWELTPKGIAYPRYNDGNRPTGTITIGTTIFNTTQNAHQYWNGSAWTNLATGGGGSNFWQLSGANGNEIANSNNGGFWSKNATEVTTVPSSFSTPVSGAGTRLMWMPAKSAFRVGTVYGNNWDSANIGLYSFATGSNTTASGYYSTAMGAATIANASQSTAMGHLSTASGISSTAMGYSSIASSFGSTAMGGYTKAYNIYSTAMGYYSTANADYSTAMGNSSIASGSSSKAMGYSSTASGSSSTAMGSSLASGSSSTAMGNSVASGYYSTAMGNSTASGSYSTAMGTSIASGNYSMAMGYNGNTNDKTNSFSIGGASVYSRAANDLGYQMKMHFNNFSFLTGTDNDVTITDGQITTSNSLSVFGLGNLTLSYGYLNAAGNTGTASGNFPYSIYSNGRSAASEFNAFSDARHKKLLSRGNGESDLALLNQLKVSHYTFIDTVGKGREIQMGFIAQEVEKIVPNAVKKLQDYIPSIYDMAEHLVYDAKLKTLTITTKKPHDFQAKDEIKLISLEKEHKVKVDKIIDAHSFVVNNWEKSLDKIFVFGKQVNDFRTVDYDRLFTLGISSIQELSRKIDALEKENQFLKAKNQEFDFLKKDVAELKAMLLK